MKTETQFISKIYEIRVFENKRKARWRERYSPPDLEMNKRDRDGLGSSIFFSSSFRSDLLQGLGFGWKKIEKEEGKGRVFYLKGREWQTSNYNEKGLK